MLVGLFLEGTTPASCRGHFFTKEKNKKIFWLKLSLHVSLNYRRHRFLILGQYLVDFGIVDLGTNKRLIHVDPKINWSSSFYFLN